MTIKMILCTDEVGGIGYKNELLYHISDDLKRFKKITEGSIVLMGRKTLESLPNQFLSHRTNVVLSNDKTYKPKNSGVIVMHDFETIINHYESGIQDKDLIIIGGKQIYESFPRYPHVIHHTKVLDVAYKKDAEVDIKELMGGHYQEYYVQYKIETHYDEDSKLFYQFTDYVKKSYLQEYHSEQISK